MFKQGFGPSIAGTLPKPQLLNFAHIPMTKYTAFRCPEDLLSKAKVKAQKDRRSLSNYLITLIERDVSVEVNGDDRAARAQPRNGLSRLKR